MIDEYNEDRTGWARFSDDRTMRYRLARSLNGRPLVVNAPGIIECDRSAVFAMLNPSVASAFIKDPTVGRGLGFATEWGCDVYEAVNIDALCSTDPRELYKHMCGSRGDDQTNNDEILRACRGAYLVVAAWGTHGNLDYRGDLVRSMLRRAGIKLHHLGLNRDGTPKHPLYLKGGTVPQEWT